MKQTDFDFLTIDKVAEILHISKQKVYALVKSGDLKVIDFGPRSRRVTRTDLENYINAHR
jgi:excisionase family DNA binding protein